MGGPGEWQQYPEPLLSSPPLSPGALFLGPGEDPAVFSGLVLSCGKTTHNGAFSKDPALSQIVNLPFAEAQENVFLMCVYVLFMCVCAYLLVCGCTYYASMHTCVIVHGKAQN